MFSTISYYGNQILLQTYWNDQNKKRTGSNSGDEMDELYHQVTPEKYLGVCL